MEDKITATEKEINECAVDLYKWVYTFCLPKIIFGILNGDVTNDRNFVREKLSQMMKPRWQTEYLVKEKVLNDIMKELYGE